MRGVRIARRSRRAAWDEAFRRTSERTQLRRCTATPQPCRSGPDRFAAGPWSDHLGEPNGATVAAARACEGGPRAHASAVSEIPQIHEQAQRGLWLVSSGQALVALLGFASGVVLARRLSPADFGLFAISTFVVVFVGMVADLGLHAALIQRRADLTTHDLRAAFTLQQLAAAVAIATLWPAAALLPIIYPATSPDLVMLVRIMSVDLFLLSWCRPSEALLERSLRYDRLVPIDVAVTTVYAIVAMALALSGVGVLTFGIAWVASTVTRLALVFRAAPWSVGLTWDRDVARSVLRFGVSLQMSRVVAQAQYWVTPTVVAATLGPTAAGLLQWAAGNGRKPLDALEHLARVSLPHFSRLQHDEHEVEWTLTRYVGGFTLVSGFWLVLLAVAGRDLVALLYTQRWVPGVPALILFAAVGVLAAVRIVITTALAGLGRTPLIGRAALASALCTIVASIALVRAFGNLGVPLGQLVGAAIALPLLAAGLGADARGRVAGAVTSALVPMIVAGIAGQLVSLVAPTAPVRAVVTTLVMVTLYVAVAWFTGASWLRAPSPARSTSILARPTDG